jgi:hypothetical protein
MYIPAVRWVKAADHPISYPETGFGEMSQLNVSIGADLLEADFWPASLRVCPGHNFRFVRHSGA